MKHNHKHCSPNNRNAFTFDKFFDEVIGNFEGIFGRDMNPVGHTIPKVNVIQNDNEYLLEIAAPGWSKSDFNVHLDKNVLTIEAQKNLDEGSKEGEKFIRKEYSNNSLKRSFNLPENTDKENISARYINGILTLTIPKVLEADIQHKIEIK